ncbi:hypothetical protein [Streptomyces parvulus]|uniref:hypothetical protein n=1 Tax=Streptomyces parvulus TaxID=146923 RepID=UPI0038157D05
MEAGNGTTVTGTGSSGNPFVISVDTVDCSQVRPCISAGNGAEYNQASGVVSARPSTDAGNLVEFGGDGGLLVTTDCATVRGCLSEGNGIDYDPVTGVIAARPSTDPGNTISFGGDGGLYSAGGGGGGDTLVTAGDTTSVNNTVSGTGAIGDPYIVSSAVILDPTPPAGGTNLIQSGPDGLYVECDQVRDCITAGDGAAFDQGAGVVEARLSTDAGNILKFGGDTGLMAEIETGCGLQGAGTAASPLAAFPIGGSRAWATDWNCNSAANSTLRCDPSTGALWTPPEHSSAAVTVQQNHPFGTPAFTATGGYVVVDPAIFSEGTYTADSLTQCRGVSFSTRFTGRVEASWTANANFDLGYAVQINGGALAVRPGVGKLPAGATAGRERWTFGVSQASVLAPHTGYVVRVLPAIRVSAGTVTLQQWITDTDLIVMTR